MEPVDVEGLVQILVQLGSNSATQAAQLQGVTAGLPVRRVATDRLELRYARTLELQHSCVNLYEAEFHDKAL